MARTKVRRWREAGPICEIAEYTRLQRSDDPRVRSVKKKKTSEVMARYNKKTSVHKFEMMLAANFIPGDIVGCVTYDDRHLPEDRKQASRRFAYFKQKLAAAYKKRGLTLVMAWSTEHKHGDGRWHHHFVCTGSGDDYELIRSLWIYGAQIDLSPLRVDDEKNYQTLATYYAKEPREKLGLRSWSFTRNAKKPVEDRELVDSNDTVEIPEKAKLVERYEVETPFGSFLYIKYMLPFDSRVRARRRKE